RSDVCSPVLFVVRRGPFHRCGAISTPPDECLTRRANRKQSAEITMLQVGFCFRSEDCFRPGLMSCQPTYDCQNRNAIRQREQTKMKAVVHNAYVCDVDGQGGACKCSAAKMSSPTNRVPVPYLITLFLNQIYHL